MAVAVTIESASEPEVRALFEALNAYLLTLCPPEQCRCISIDELMDDETTVFVARDADGRALGVGALHRHPGNVGEVLGMYTLPDLRGQGIGSAILANIVRLATASRFDRLVLETGDRHPDAWRLYEHSGFTRCGPVLDYEESEWSVFYEKKLEPAA